MSISNWEVEGEVIREYRGLPMQCGVEIVHHGHHEHPTVRAAMWRGNAKSVAAAIVAANERRWHRFGAYVVDPDGRVRSRADGWPLEVRGKDVRGWPVDLVERITETLQIGMFASISVRDFNGNDLLPTFAAPEPRIAFPDYVRRDQ